MVFDQRVTALSKPETGCSPLKHVFEQLRKRRFQIARYMVSFLDR